MVIADDDQPRFDGSHDGGCRLRVHVTVERDDDRAELPQGEQINRRAQPARRPEHDPVTGLDAAFSQVSCQSIDVRQQLAGIEGAPA